MDVSHPKSCKRVRCRKGLDAAGPDGPLSSGLPASSFRNECVGSSLEVSPVLLKAFQGPTVRAAPQVRPNTSEIYLMLRRRRRRRFVV
eukprot:1181904-Prorocentrum_minimum.AAC.6